MNRFVFAGAVEETCFYGDWNSFSTVRVEPDFQKQIEKGSDKDGGNGNA
jgi:hypothetical protein